MDEALMRGRVGRGDERCGEKIMNAGDASWAPHSLCFTTTRGAALERRVYTCQFCRGFSIDFIQDPPFEAIVEHEESDEHENNVQAARLRVLPGYIEPLQMLDLLMKGRWLFTDRWYSFWEKAREPFDVALSRLFMLVAYESSNSGSELPTAISPEELYTEKLLEVFDKFESYKIRCKIRLIQEKFSLLGLLFPPNISAVLYDCLSSRQTGPNVTGIRWENLLLRFRREEEERERGT